MKELCRKPAVDNKCLEKNEKKKEKVKIEIEIKKITKIRQGR